MSDVEPTWRELCLRCRRPRSVCWCSAVTRVESRTHVVFVQHPRETKVPVSTCRMAHLSLPNSELHVALRVEGNAALEAACRVPGAAVLFPSEDATDVADLAEAPSTLVVVDGTWSNAKKVVEKCPVLSRLPRIAFKPDKPGNYRIRKEPEEHCLATIEAVAYVLERLEQAPGRFTPILSAFDAMVERQLDFINAGGNTSRHKFRRARNSVPIDPTAALRENAERLVVVFGEANAWPMRELAPGMAPPEQYEPELVQLVAERLSTGERFEALLRPKTPLGPRVPFHLDVPAEVILAAPERASVLEQWSAFLRDGELLVGWGGFCRDLLDVERARRPEFINLRSVLAQVRGAKPGAVEVVAERLGHTLPSGQGRAARRLTSLLVVTRATIDGSIRAALPEAA